jgi:hypothetical protein
MPYLELDGGMFDFCKIYAAMAHPDNERYRHEFEATHICQRILENTNIEIENPKLLLKAILNSPSFEDVVKRSAISTGKGVVAGDVLRFLAQMHYAGQQEPSVRKAVYLVKDYLSDAVDSFGNKGATSEISIRKCWETYKPVAHYWAAFRACSLSPHNDFPKLSETLFGDELNKFLAIAEFFRRFAENFKPSRIKLQEPLLPIDDLWRIPENYKLPEISLDVDELPEWMVDCLKEYKNTTINY